MTFGHCFSDGIFIGTDAATRGDARFGRGKELSGLPPSTRLLPQLPVS